MCPGAWAPSFSRHLGPPQWGAGHARGGQQLPPLSAWLALIFSLTLPAPWCTCTVEPHIIACCTRTPGDQAGGGTTRTNLAQWANNMFASHNLVMTCTPDLWCQPDCPLAIYLSASCLHNSTSYLSCPTCPYLHTTFQWPTLHHVCPTLFCMCAYFYPTLAGVLPMKDGQAHIHVWLIEGSACSQKHIVVTCTYCITKWNTMISRHYNIHGVSDISHCTPLWLYSQ